MTYLIALLIVCAAAAAIAYPFFRPKDRTWETETEEESRDLKLRRQNLYDAIRELELERETGSISQEEFEKIRVSYERQAAALLQEEERQGRRRPPHTPAPAKAAASTIPPISHRLGLLIPAAVILLVGVSLGYFLSTSVKPRQTEMSITGSIPGGRGETPSSLQEANAAFTRGEMRQALDGYKKILEQDPHNVEALTQIGVILARARHYDDALLAFDQALKVRPDDPKALFEKGLVYFQGKVQPREGVKVWEHLIKTAPPDNQYAMTAKRMLDQVRASMGRPPSESSTKPSTK